MAPPVPDLKIKPASRATLARARIMAQALAQLSPNEREEIFALLRERFCLDCGRQQPALPPFCQCENEE
jgi:hypothetical protein